MKFFLESPFFRSRYLVAFVAGLLLTAAYPRIGLPGFAWVAPGIMIAAALGKRGAEAFRVGFVAGLTHYLSLLYWLLLIPYRWHGLPLAPALGWLVLSAVLALFPAAWVWLVGSGGIASAKAPCLGSGPTLSARPCYREEDEGISSLPWFGLLGRNWLGRMLWTVCAAAAWVAFEMIRARVLGGFPWALLGVSQYQMAPLIQIASVTGVYGVSFVVAWVSLALLSAGLMVIRRPAARSVWVGEVFLPIVVVAVLFHIGFRQIRADAPSPRTLKVLLVQPSIPQSLIWNPNQDTNRFEQLLLYSDQALTNGADLLIWPESAVPKMLRYDKETFNAITRLARRHHVWMIVGSDDAEPKQKAKDPDAANYFNSSFLITPEGNLAERYTKRSLVIFGEYVPFERWLPFLGYFTPVQGGFTPGTRPVEFNLADLDVKTSVLICFEDIFPQLGRTDVLPATDFLVNITNDGWFGHSAAQWQHATTALFRAVENQVPLIRCCNNGLTCWIDARGRLREILRDDRRTVYGTAFMRAEIPVLPPGETHRLTFYTRNGDVFGWGCVGVAAVMLVPKVLPRRRKIET